MTYRHDTQRAAIADVLCSSVHHKGVRFTAIGPSDNALSAIEAAEASQVLQKLLGTYKAVSQDRIARLLERCWAVSLDLDTAALTLACDDDGVRATLKADYLTLLQERAALFGLSSVRIVSDATTLGMSSGERLMVLVAWAIWNGRGGVELAALLHTLDGHNLRKVGTLLMALSAGSSAVLDEWLSDWEEHEGVARG